MNDSGPAPSPFKPAVASPAQDKGRETPELPQESEDHFCFTATHQQAHTLTLSLPLTALSLSLSHYLALSLMHTHKTHTHTRTNTLSLSFSSFTATGQSARRPPYVAPAQQERELCKV